MLKFINLKLFQISSIYNILSARKISISQNYNGEVVYSVSVFMNTQIYLICVNMCETLENH